MCSSLLHQEYPIDKKMQISQTAANRLGLITELLGFARCFGRAPLQKMWRCRKNW